MSYTTPRACYRKAPVRRETPVEMKFRHRDQIPRAAWIWVRLARKTDLVMYTVNATLIPGEAQYVKDVSNRV